MEGVATSGGDTPPPHVANPSTDVRGGPERACAAARNGREWGRWAGPRPRPPGAESDDLDAKAKALEGNRADQQAQCDERIVDLLLQNIELGGKLVVLTLS